MSWIDSLVRLRPCHLIAKPLCFGTRELIEPSSDVASAGDSDVQMNSLNHARTG